MVAWMESYRKGDTSHLGEAVKYSLSTISIFIVACLAVIDDILMTAESHEAFLQVFAPSLAANKTCVKASQARAEFFRCLSVTIKKNPKWKDLDTK
jgi:hypothetical protein